MFYILLILIINLFPFFKKTLWQKSVFWLMAIQWQYVTDEQDIGHVHLCWAVFTSSFSPFLLHFKQNIYGSCKVTESNYFLIISACQHLDPKCIPIGSINSTVVKYIYFYRFFFKLQHHINSQYHLISNPLIIRPTGGVVS